MAASSSSSWDHFSAPAPHQLLPLQSVRHLTKLDVLHYAGRALLTFLFVYSVIFNLSHIDDAADRLIAHAPITLSHTVAAAIVGCALLLSVLGSALFFAQADPYGIYLLLAFLLPVTVSEHLVPYIAVYRSTTASDWEKHASFVSLLKNVSIIGSLIVIYCYHRQNVWNEGQRKQEIRTALEAFYAKQQAQPVEGKKGK